MLKNKLLIALLCLPFLGKTQVLEAESIPRSFEIDQSLEIDETSAAIAFDIEPYRVRIRREMEKRAKQWFEIEGKQHAHEVDFEQRFVKELEVIQPEVIQEIGSKELTKCHPTCFIQEKSLKLEVHFPGFRPAAFDLPLAEMEAFKNNLGRVVFTGAEVAFDEEDHFVLIDLIAFNPANQKKYAFHSNLPPWFKSPSFNISIPSIEE